MRQSSMLLCMTGGRLCALPLAHVIETMRPLPIEPFGGMAPFVSGASVVRGAPVPVIDLGLVLGLATGGEQQPGRFVLLRAGERRVALAVEAVIGIREIASESLGELPRLLNEAKAEVVSAIGALDSALLLVLEAMRLAPDSTWHGLDSPSSAA